MITSPRRTLALLSSAVLVVVALTGCSAIGSVSSAASKVESCAAIAGTMSSASSDIAGSVSSMTSDPAAALEKLKAVSTDFHASLEKLKNADVKKAAETADASLTALVEKVDAAVANPASADSTALQAAAATVSDDFVAIGKVCTPS